MLNAFIVGAGGFVGSVLRYLVGIGVNRLSGHHFFPFATLTVNIVGCFVIGLLGGYMLTRDLFGDHMRLFIMVGMLGGFTTFSTFGNETVHLVKASQPLPAVLYVILHVVLGLGAAWWGHHLVK